MPESVEMPAPVSTTTRTAVSIQPLTVSIAGRQPGLELTDNRAAAEVAARTKRPPRAPRTHAPSAQELEAHAALMEKLKDPIWLKE